MTRIGLVFFLFVLLGCSNKTEVPRNILNEESMKKVLWDVFLAESWARQTASHDSTIILSDEIKRLTSEALKEHHLTEKEFFNSYSWYVAHPEVLNPILDSLYNQKSARPVLSDDEDIKTAVEKNRGTKPLPHREVK